MGLCNKCMDTTRYITVTNSTENSNLLNYTLPSGLSISPNPLGYDPYLSVSYDVDFASTIFDETEWNATIASLTALSWVGTGTTSLGSPVGSPIAVSCLAYACLKNFYGYVDTGELKETVVSVVAAPAVLSDGAPADLLAIVNDESNYTTIKEPCRLDGQFYDRSNFSSISRGNHSFEAVNLSGTNTSVPFECIYKMSGLMGFALQAYVEETLFTGQGKYSAGRANSFTCGDQWWLTPLYNDGNATLASVSQIMYVLPPVFRNHYCEITCYQTAVLKAAEKKKSQLPSDV